MSNKFASALKPQRAPEVPAADPVIASERETKKQPSRRYAKHLGGYFDPAVIKQIHQIAIDEDTTAQSLLAEALDMLFQSRQKPTIARKPAEGRAA